MPPAAAPARPRAIPRGIWALGLVSLLMDTSSEAIHSLLPAFLVTVLGASVIALGLIEGVAEATAAFAKVFSGALSDYLGRRKGLALAGYGLAAITKPMFALATAVDWIFAARVIDRIGKGIRGAPRDALVSEISPPEIRGACYGLRQALDTVGAFAGPLAAIALMELLAGDMRAVFWVAVIPAALSVVVLAVAVREPPSVGPARSARVPLRWRQIRGLGRPYWSWIVVGTVFTLARFSEAFLVLKAETAGLALALLPLVFVVMSISYAASAYPIGRLSDRVGRRGLLAIGCLVLIAADAIIALATTPIVVLIGVAIWGLHMGLTQGLFAALIADTSAPDLRGTAFGIFHLTSGIALFAASLLAGVLWQHAGAAATFVAGGVLAAMALVTLGVARR